MAEAQLTNITRQKFKEAYDLRTAAIIERAEKQIILATQARRVLNLLDDTPIVPGEERQAFPSGAQMQEYMQDVESQLKNWSPSLEPIHSSAGKLGVNAMPGTSETLESPSSTTMSTAQQRVEQRERAQDEGREDDEQPAPPYPESTTASAA